MFLHLPTMMDSKLLELLAKTDSLPSVAFGLGILLPQQESNLYITIKAILYFDVLRFQLMLFPVPDHLCDPWVSQLLGFSGLGRFPKHPLFLMSLTAFEVLVKNTIGDPGFISCFSHD